MCVRFINHKLICLVPEPTIVPAAMEAMSENPIKLELHQLLSQFINDSSQMKTRVEQLKGNIQQAWGCLLKVEGMMKFFEDPKVLSTILLALEAVGPKETQASTFADASTQTSRRNVAFSEDLIEEMEFCDDQSTDNETAPAVTENAAVAETTVVNELTNVNPPPPSTKPGLSGQVGYKGEVKPRPCKAAETYVGRTSVPGGKASWMSQVTPKNAPIGSGGSLSGVNSRRRLPTSKTPTMDSQVTPITATQMHNLQKSRSYPSKSKLQMTLESKKRAPLHTENLHTPTKNPNFKPKTGLQLKVDSNEGNVNQPAPLKNLEKSGAAEQEQVIKTATAMLQDETVKHSSMSKTMPSLGVSSLAADLRSTEATVTRSARISRVRPNTRMSYAEPSLRAKLRRD